jgi:hypothetical protein
MSFKSPETVLRAALVGNTSVTSLVGTRIYPVVAPASAAKPFVTWRRSGIRREQALSRPIGVPQVSVDYSVYASTYQEARQVADRLRLVLDGYAGTADNTVVVNVSLENETDEFVTLQGSDLADTYSVVQTYEIAWQES